MTSKEIKRKIKDVGLCQWQVAMETGIAEMTLIRWLRAPMNEERANRINDAIERLIKGGEHND